MLNTFIKLTQSIIEKLNIGLFKSNLNIFIFVFVLLQFIYVKTVTIKYT